MQRRHSKETVFRATYDDRKCSVLNRGIISEKFEVQTHFLRVISEVLAAVNEGVQ